MQAHLLSTLLCATTFLANAGSANAQNDFAKAFAEGKPLLDMRYRYEYFDQEGLTNGAQAHNL